MQSRGKGGGVSTRADTNFPVDVAPGVARKPSAISKRKSKNTRPSCAKITSGGASALSPAPKPSPESVPDPLNCLPGSRSSALNRALSANQHSEKQPTKSAARGRQRLL